MSRNGAASVPAMAPAVFAAYSLPPSLPGYGADPILQVGERRRRMGQAERAS
ncbi:MAG: hypothetical protein WCA85_21085 [Paraburkholderia sp.]